MYCRTASKNSSSASLAIISGESCSCAAYLNELSIHPPAWEALASTLSKGGSMASAAPIGRVDSQEPAIHPRARPLASVRDVVIGDDVARRRHVGSAVFRIDVRVERPRGRELRFQKDRADQSHAAQRFVQLLHPTVLRSAGVSDKSSGVSRIADRAAGS